MKKKHLNYSNIKNIPVKFIPIMFLVYLSINILSLTLPLAMKKIYGSIIVSKSEESLRFIIILVLVALFFESVMKRLKDSSSKWIACKYEYFLSVFLMEKMLNSFPELVYNRNHINDLEKFNSVPRLASFYSTRYYQIFIDLPFSLLFLYLIYVFGGPIVLVPITLSLIYVILLTIISTRYFKNRSSELESNDSLINQLTETLEKIHLVKGAGIEESQITKYEEKLEQLTYSTYISNKYDAMPRILSSNFSQINLFAILVVGGIFVSYNQITFGAITACAMLGGRAISPVISIMTQFFQKKDIQLINERIEDIINLPEQYSEDIPPFPDDISGLIELVDLEFTNIQSHNKEYISYKIPSGTLLHIDPSDFLSYKDIIHKISGQKELSSGKVLIDSLDINLWDMSTLKGKIEYLSETVKLYKGSVLDNITYFNNKKIQNAYTASAITGLDTIISQLPEGFETQIDSFSSNYMSPAFMQRLNLTRAFVERPRILILDRIDESMDKDTLSIFKWLLDSFKGTLTIIMVTQNEDFIKLSDQSLNMKG